MGLTFFLSKIYLIAGGSVAEELHVIIHCAVGKPLKQDISALHVIFVVYLGHQVART